MKKSRKIDDSDLKDLLLNPKLNNRGQYICSCPFCGKDKHFYISKETQLFDCKKCGEYGSVYKLLKFFDKTYLMEGATVEQTETLKTIREMIEEEINNEVELNLLPVRILPAGWKTALTSTYLINERGLTTKDIKRYGLGQTTLISKYKNYILIPIKDNDEIRGFIGRYAAKKVPSDRLRYNNSGGTNFSQLLFGFDELVKNKTLTVILVEGIFDKIAVDKFLSLWDDVEIKCCCTFGKKISPEQEAKLKSKGIVNVVLLYDFDAIKEIKRYGLELEKNFFTSIVYTLKKDIDECNFEEAMKVFSEFKKPRDFNVDVIGKLKK